MSDLHVDGVPADATIEQLDKAITDREALVQTLVGQLYPPIVKAAIYKLYERRERLRRKARMERKAQP